MKKLSHDVVYVAKRDVEVGFTHYGFLKRGTRVRLDDIRGNYVGILYPPEKTFKENGSNYFGMTAKAFREAFEEE